MEIRGLSNLDLSNSVAVAVAKKTLNAARAEGSAMTQLIEDAKKISEGRRVSAGDDREPGRQVDVYA